MGWAVVVAAAAAVASRSVVMLVVGRNRQTFVLKQYP